MADPFEPTSPPPPEPIPPNPSPPPEPPPRVDNPTTQSTGLPSNIAAALACIPLVGGLIFWFLEKHDNFVRFYAMQSIIFGAACDSSITVRKSFGKKSMMVYGFEPGGRPLKCRE